MSCTNKKVEYDNFDFSIVWGVHGMSSYDSSSGTLIKTTYFEKGSSQDDYKTQLYLSKETKDNFVNMLNNINIYSYPKNYDPYYYKRRTIYSTPGYKIKLSIPDLEIETRDTLPMYSDDVTNISKEGKSFLSCIDSITTYIENTSEWKSLKDSEVTFL